jgi:hypothetical protein
MSLCARARVRVHVRVRVRMHVRTGRAGHSAWEPVCVRVRNCLRGRAQTGAHACTRPILHGRLAGAGAGRWGGG